MSDDVEVTENVVNPGGVDPNAGLDLGKINQDIPMMESGPSIPASDLGSIKMPTVEDPPDSPHFDEDEDDSYNPRHEPPIPEYVEEPERIASRLETILEATYFETVKLKRIMSVVQYLLIFVAVAAIFYLSKHVRNLKIPNVEAAVVNPS